MRTKVEYCPKLIPMNGDMERNVIKALKLHTKDECIVTAEQVIKLFTDYKSTKGHLPKEWEDYVRNVLQTRKNSCVCTQCNTNIIDTDDYDRYQGVCIECQLEQQA